MEKNKEIRKIYWEFQRDWFEADYEQGYIPNSKSIESMNEFFKGKNVCNVTDTVRKIEKLAGFPVTYELLNRVTWEDGVKGYLAD